MTVVVADTSPLNYLVPIGEFEVLRRLYGRASSRRRFSPSFPTAVLRPNWLDGFAPDLSG
jgi:predicted nucleic acid-binding protein